MSTAPLGFVTRGVADVLNIGCRWCWGRRGCGRGLDAQEFAEGGHNVAGSESIDVGAHPGGGADIGYGDSVSGMVRLDLDGARLDWWINTSGVVAVVQGGSARRNG